MKSKKQTAEEDIFLQYGEELTGDRHRHEVRKKLKARKAAGRRIDPKTAEVMWEYIDLFDPYNIGQNLDVEELRGCICRGYFARAPGSDIWVEFADLPKAVRDAMWGKHRKELAFPAGLEPALTEPTAA